MKRFLISSFLCLISVLSLAANETVVVLTNTGDGIAETPTELKPVNPCSQLLFKVNINIPVGYVIVSKYEWFVNGISTYVNTTDPGNQSFLYTVISNPTNVYCKVTYQKQDGTTTAPSTSTTFTPIIKQLDFPLSISTSTPPPN